MAKEETLEGSLTGVLGPWKSDAWKNGPCAKLEDCAYCARIYGPPRCEEYCLNFTVVDKESMIVSGENEITWCHGFRAEPKYCFLRWSLDLPRKYVHVPYNRRCVGSPSAVVGMVFGVLLLLALVLSLGLGLPGYAMNAWRHRPMRRSTRSSTHSSSRSRSSRSGFAGRSVYSRQTSVDR